MRLTRAAEIMAEIAKLAVPQGKIEIASTDHDRILYGGPEGALYMAARRALYNFFRHWRLVRIVYS